MTLATARDTPAGAAETPAGRSIRPVLVAVIAIAALMLAGAVGYLLGHRDGGTATPSASSVDAGFAWDMSVHHRQAVTMAGYARDHTTDGVIRTLAYDIETSQFNQVGEMQGWLDGWGLPPENPGTQMSWMGGASTSMGVPSMPSMAVTGGLMPGMATPAQISKLETLTGNALDIDFLQLMLHHHQGGVPMAQYAAAHGTTSYVRNFAQKIADGQSAEILTMEQLLRERGASPLAPPG